MNQSTVKQESPLNQIDLSELSSNRALQVIEVPFQGFVILRGDSSSGGFMSGCQRVLSAEPPTVPNTLVRTDALEVLWCGPDEWLIITPPKAGAALAERLSTALKDMHASVTEITGGNTTLEVSGACAPDLLAKGSPLDFHASQFRLGQCAQTVMAKAGATIYPIGDGDTFRLIIRRSFADYLGTWLLDAAKEFVQH